MFVFAFKHLALLWNLSRYFIIILQGYFVKCGLNVRREFLVLWERGFLESPHIPHSVLSTHTLHSHKRWSLCIFYNHFCTENSGSESNVKSCEFFAPLCHFFMSRKVPRHFRAISWRWLSFPCVDKKAQIFTLPLSYPPAKCCHLSMCAQHIFLNSLAQTLLVELKWV